MPPPPDPARIADLLRAEAAAAGIAPEGPLTPEDVLLLQEAFAERLDLWAPDLGDAPGAFDALQAWAVREVRAQADVLDTVDDPDARAREAVERTLAAVGAAASEPERPIDGWETILPRLPDPWNLCPIRLPRGRRRRRAGRRTVVATALWSALALALWRWDLGTTPAARIFFALVGALFVAEYAFTPVDAYRAAPARVASLLADAHRRAAERLAQVRERPDANETA